MITKLINIDKSIYETKLHINYILTRGAAIIRNTTNTVTNKKLSCRRETARRFVLLNTLLSHSRSLKVIRNDTVACVSSVQLRKRVFLQNLLSYLEITYDTL